MTLFGHYRRSFQIIICIVFVFITIESTACGMKVLDSSPATNTVSSQDPIQPLRAPEHSGTIWQSDRIANYSIQTSLDADTHRLTNKMRMHWRNTSEESISSLPFHLYMNGFRASDTIWMKGASGSHRSNNSDANALGYIDIKSIHLISVNSDPVEPQKISDAKQSPSLFAANQAPEPLQWREDEDPSTMEVRLSSPLNSGSSLVLEFTFETQLPHVFARTGYSDDFHLVAQWFPKIGVLSPDGTWSNHTFTLHSEFFADFGRYEVEIDVPSEMVVGASGIRINEEQIDGRKKLSYVADMVHDFAWVADPNLVEFRKSYHDISIRQLVPKDQVDTAKLHMDVVLDTLSSLEYRFGNYPWSSLTIVLPPEHASGAQGMEYPTFFTTSAILDLGVPSFIAEERITGLMTSTHELGHQFFQGLLGSDESAEPWLDEGINMVSNHLAYNDMFGEDPWIVRVLNIDFTLNDLLRISSLLNSLNGSPYPVAAPANKFLALPDGYGLTVYQKTAAIMLTLRNMVGSDLWDQAMHEYAETWRFRHPTGADLQAQFAQVLGTIRSYPAGYDKESQPSSTVEFNINAFFNQSLHSTREVDFSIHSLHWRPLMSDYGWHRDKSGQLTYTPPPDNLNIHVEHLPTEAIESQLIVSRLGNFSMPVEIEVEFVDGETSRFAWSGQEPFQIFTWPQKKVHKATIDPRRHILLETKRNNNLRFVDYPSITPQSPPADLAQSLSTLLQTAGMTVFALLGP